MSIIIRTVFETIQWYLQAFHYWTVADLHIPLKIELQLFKGGSKSDGAHSILVKHKKYKVVYPSHAQ